MLTNLYYLIMPQHLIVVQMTMPEPIVPDTLVGKQEILDVHFGTKFLNVLVPQEMTITQLLPQEGLQMV